MRAIRAIVYGVVGAATLMMGATGFAQIVINEFVIDERTAGSGIIHPSTREFVELYNAGESAIDLSGWTLTTLQIGSNFGLPAGTATYTISSGSIAANEYFVIGHAGVPNVDFTPPTPAFNGDLFPDGNPQATNNGNFVFELRDSGSTLRDAVAVETFRGTERDNLTAEQLAFTGGGIWPQLISTNVPSPNTVTSMARYIDGNTTNANGRDFGVLPATPGNSNSTNFPQVVNHIVPDVDSLAIETPLGGDYYASFVLPRVVDPTVPDGIVNPNATAPLPAPLTGGNAVMAFDETGGGNASYSKELVNAFDIYAYVDTAELGPATGSEATIYGIGTTDPFFATSNSAGLLTATSTANGSTGVGWLIQRAKRDFGSGVETRTVLQLIHFDDGGDSLPADGEWDVIQEFTLTGEASAWHRLGIEYDPNTGIVTGRLDDDTFEFSYAGTEGDYNDDGVVDAADYVVWRRDDGTQEGYDAWRANFGGAGGGGELFGTFYVGYREALAANFATSRPPTFVQFEPLEVTGHGGAVPEPSSVALLMLGLVGVALKGRRRG